MSVENPMFANKQRRKALDLIRGSARPEVFLQAPLYSKIDFADQRPLFRLYIGPQLSYIAHEMLWHESAANG